MTLPPDAAEQLAATDADLDAAQVAYAGMTELLRLAQAEADTMRAHVISAQKRVRAMSATLGDPSTGVIGRIEISPTSLGLQVGQTQQLTATAYDSGSDAIMAGVTFTWASSAPGVASVNGSGLVTALGAGICSISVGAIGSDLTAPTTCTVSAVPVASLDLTPTALGLTEGGGTGAFTAQPRDAQGNALTGRVVTADSSNPALASVGVSGYTVTVTPVAAGAPVVTAYCEGVPSPSRTVNVVAPSADPYEPGGYTVLTDRPFAAVAEDGWSSFGAGNLKTDATDEPTSPPTCIEWRKDASNSPPASQATSFTPGLFGLVLSPQRTKIYMRCSLWLSPQFYGNSSLVNKLSPFFIVDGIPEIFLNAAGSGAGNLYFRCAAQGCPKNLGPIDGSGGANLGGQTALITRGIWYIIRMHLILNTYGVADGTLQLWVTDTTTGVTVQPVNRTNMAYIGPGTSSPTSASSKISELRLNAIHGGGPELPLTDTRIRMGHYYVSGL